MIVIRLDVFWTVNRWSVKCTILSAVHQRFLVKHLLNTGKLVSQLLMGFSLHLLVALIYISSNHLADAAPIEICLSSSNICFYRDTENSQNRQKDFELIKVNEINVITSFHICYKNFVMCYMLLSMGPPRLILE